VTPGRWLRVTAASAVLVALAAFAVALAPLYYRNLRFASALRELSGRPGEPDASLRAAVLERAARLNLPVREADVALRRSPGRVRIDVRYSVPVDLPAYSVNLHFHPIAGR
jgi:hypothetical protein